MCKTWLEISEKPPSRSQLRESHKRDNGNHFTWLLVYVEFNVVESPPETPGTEDGRNGSCSLFICIVLVIMVLFHMWFQMWLQLSVSKMVRTCIKFEGIVLI